MRKIKIRIIQIIVILKSIYYYLYCKIFKKYDKDLWLIAERGDDARDNGFAFYLYLKQYHKEIKVKYVIAKNSPDINKIPEEDRVYYRSKEHYIAFFTAKNLISSHILGYSPEFRMYGKLDKLGLVKVQGNKIFLQHGITKDNIKELHKDNVSLDLFICGAKPEYKYILEKFGFDNNVVKYTGFARYDKLISDEKDYILVMPTWRKEIYYCDDEKFRNTEYFRRYNEMLNDEKLHNILKNNNIKLIFYPHYEIQKFIKCFNTKFEEYIIADIEKFDVQKLLIEAKILITDYSSVFFDFAYMHKPIIYYQFDYKEYRKSHYKEGYYSYEKNAFGPICYNIEDIAKMLEKYIDSRFMIEEEYLDKIKHFFEYNDCKNSERIYKEINKIKI